MADLDFIAICWLESVCSSVLLRWKMHVPSHELEKYQAFAAKLLAIPSVAQHSGCWMGWNSFIEFPWCGKDHSKFPALALARADIKLNAKLLPAMLQRKTLTFHVSVASFSEILVFQQIRHEMSWSVCGILPKHSLANCSYLQLTLALSKIIHMELSVKNIAALSLWEKQGNWAANVSGTGQKNSHVQQETVDQIEQAMRFSEGGKEWAIQGCLYVWSVLCFHTLVLLTLACDEAGKQGWNASHLWRDRKTKWCYAMVPKTRGEETDK